MTITKSSLLALLALLATVRSQDCSSYSSCSECVESECAWSIGVCYNACLEADKTASCFVAANYVGLEVEEICALDDSSTNEAGIRPIVSTVDGSSDSDSSNNPFACAIGENTSCRDCLEARCVYTNNLCLTECAIMDIACWDMQYHADKSIGAVCDLASNDLDTSGVEVGGTVTVTKPCTNVTDIDNNTVIICDEELDDSTMGGETKTIDADGEVEAQFSKLESSSSSSSSGVAVNHPLFAIPAWMAAGLFLVMTTTATTSLL